MTTKDICAGRKYTDKEGNEKTQWSVIGKMFIKEDGKMSILIESIPLGWNGNAMVFDQKADNQTATQAQQPAPAKHKTDGDIPF